MTENTVPGADERGEAVSYAPFWHRAAALFIDGLIMLGIVVSSLLMLRVVLQTMGWDPASSPPIGLEPASSSSEHFDLLGRWRALGWPRRLFAIIVFHLTAGGGIYYPLCHSSPWQATLGKRILGIKVIDHSLRRLSFGRAVGRVLSKQIVHLGGYLSPISALTIIFSSKKQAIHDFLAGTTVVRGEPSPDARLGLWRVAVFCGMPSVLFLIMFFVPGF